MLGYAQTPASPQIMADVKSGDFQDAASLATATGDPLMVKLVVYFKLLDPGGGSADEIQAFIAANPDWPEQGLLALREAQAAGIRPARQPNVIPDFLQKAAALHENGQDGDAAALWAAQGQAASVAATAPQKLMFWPVQERLARSLFAANDAKEALAVIKAVAPPAIGSIGRAQTASRDFLAGFIQLRALHDPARAAIWFTRLAASSTAVITQARAWYWLGRSQTGTAAHDDYERAAGYPDAFYGQLAALALGDTPRQLAARIIAAGEPSFTPGDVLNFAGMELPRAAALLVQMDDPADAAIFLNRLGQVAVDDRTRELAARLALGLGLPQSAVGIARVAGISGQMLVREGWPRAVPVPSGPLEPAIAYGIMRQESSFDTGAVSGSGAMGLMQLMPGTARRAAGQSGLPDDDLFDPAQNIALGSFYLSGLIQQFGNCLPLAVAAYNAGPNNVANWLAENGDPELGAHPGGADMIDWIEEIPFPETRNYVQRVTENIVVYRALLTGMAADPLSPWMLP
ncbi:MAG: lytic transglycosylase domain-containing protein [Acidocella sp.]|nr:lytic transglycosylase domain-containing protein [Acidocella sp.]